LEAALAACMNMSARIEAERRGFPPLEIRTAVALDRSQPGKAVYRLRCRVDGPLAPGERASLEAAAKACPLGETLARTPVLLVDPTLEVTP
jgi:uncharacterized OsmC-like protein